MSQRDNEITGVVTVLDVLGWKGIWQRKTEPIKDLESIVNLVRKIANERERGLQSKRRLPLLEQKLNPPETSIMIISDTIVFFTEASLGNVKEKIELHGELCAAAIPDSIRKGLPLRGATCYGDVVISQNQNIFAGKAIDEAAAWHEQADWVGVFLTPSASLLFTDIASNYWVTTKMEIPMKKKEHLFKTHAVNWIDKENADRFVNEVKKDFVQLAPIIPEIVSKISNTLDFIRAVVDIK